MPFKPYRIVETGPEVRLKIKRGIDIVANVVKSTLGSCGKNALIEWKRRAPVVTNDGISIAREIFLRDELENLGAQTLIEVGNKTNEMVGDGTTTSMVLAWAIINEMMKDEIEGELLIKNKTNLMEKYRQVKTEQKKVIEELNKMAIPVKDKETMIRVASLSVENEELGKMIADIREKIGINGFISVEENFGYETEYEITSGMKVPGTYAATWMITHLEKKQAIFEDCPILILNQNIETGKDLMRNPATFEGIINDLLQSGESRLVIMAPKFLNPALLSLYIAATRSNFKTLAVKIPALTNEEIEDIAIYTGARFLDKDKGDTADKAVKEDLGRVEKIIVTKDDIFIIGGKKNRKAIKERIDALKEQKKLEKTDMFKKRLERRIASLSGGVGLIKVGARTDTERTYLKLKVEDGDYALKAAMEEGVVPGGGLALKKIADKMPKGSILKEALKIPYLQIQENAGGKLEIGKDVLDPVKVTKTALENACSLAGIFITIESAIAMPRSDLEDEIINFLQKYKLGPDEPQSN